MSYERRISAEEAKGKFVFILKNALKKFPQIDKPFTVQLDDRKYSTKIRSIPCNCIGTLHEHYHMPVENIPEMAKMKKGSIIAIRKLSDNVYSISIKNRN